MLLDNVCVRKGLIHAKEALNVGMLSDLVAKEVDFVLLELFSDLGSIHQFDLIDELDAHELPRLCISCNSMLVMVILSFAE